MASSTLAAPPVPAGLATALVAWQRQHGRHALPWQQTRDPYRVWLSEIMLQQTQVSTVLGYYERFLLHFPEVAALAAAPLDDVLALWAGLGYYSRARNLHACAQAVVKDHGGCFPTTAAALMTLPGIGRSTAAAIAAFCFGERVAILDGNVKRVLTRVLGFGDDLAVSRHEKRLWQLATEVLPEGPGIEAYTQGLMDLGATLCSQRAPQCGVCPLQALCTAHAQGRPQDYPVKTRKLKRGQRAHILLWLQHAGRTWLVQRPGKGVWAGLWSLPEFEDEASARAAVQPWPGVWTALGTVQHVLTHLDLSLTPLRLDLTQAPTLQDLKAHWPTGNWVEVRELDRYGLPAPIKKLMLGL